MTNQQMSSPFPPTETGLLFTLLALRTWSMSPIFRPASLAMWSFVRQKNQLPKDFSARHRPRLRPIRLVADLSSS